MTNNIKLNRIYGYDILINTFEPFLRKYLINEVLIINYANDWKEHIPKGVLDELYKIKGYKMPDDCSIDDFFEELTFLNLKDIIIASDNFKLVKYFFGDLSKDKFIELMDDLNKYRRKIAHPSSTFSDLDLSNLIEYVGLLCQGESAKPIKIYLQNEQYKNARDIPSYFFEEYECENNLPPEDYDLDGGFVGREKEIHAIMKLIKSYQDRIITISGAGGVGKSAIALKVAYSFLFDYDNPFEAIVWFSAKNSKLTESGIIPMDPKIRSDEQLIKDILQIIDPKTTQNFINSNVPLESYKTHLYNIFSSKKCLIIIDNLETILGDDALINFIKYIPRPSQVLITSRKGLGELEYRYPITDMSEKDAIRLFRIIAKERNMLDLLRFKEEMISRLVKQVKCYPLIIKWGIGQICLGKDVETAFSQVFKGESDIAKFIFEDIFVLLSENSRYILYSMVVYGDKPVSGHILMHLTNLNEDAFEDAIRELIKASLVIPENKEIESGKTVVEFLMLPLTRGFVEYKLDSDQKTRNIINTRHYHFLEQAAELEKSKKGLFQTIVDFGIKTPEDMAAFNYVKTAKNLYYHGDMENAEKNFEQAIKISPKCSYALGEYSKFEFKIGHIQKALKLAAESVDVNPENYHSWFSYGISLRKAHKFQDSIKVLQKAKELNPIYPPISNELGRAYSITGDYEKAEAEFKEALKEEKYPNYRHKVITLQFLADNYKRWAELFDKRRDFTGEIRVLKQAHEKILEAIKISPNDNLLWRLYWEICRDLGVTLCKSDNSRFDEGMEYLEKCVSPSQHNKITTAPSNETVASTCFFIAAFMMNRKDADIRSIRDYIKKGLTACAQGSKYFSKLKSLEIQLLKKYPSEEDVNGRNYGVIKYYNTERKFGVISTPDPDKTYLFFLAGFRQRIYSEMTRQLEGIKVSFIPIKNPQKDDSMIASDIIPL